MADPLGSVPGIVVGVGVGAAAAAAIEPAVELPKQTAWKANPNRILDAATIARLVAQGGVSLDSAHESGLRDGFGPDKLDALVYLSQTVPGFAQVLDLWRRDLIGPELVQHALTKEGTDQRYVDQLLKLKTAEIIPPPDLAYMVVRGLVPDPFGYDGPSDEHDKTISDIPQLDIKTLEEAARSGWDQTRFEALVGRSGLAPAPIFAAAAFFRGLITYDQYLTIIKKGDLRPAYANVILNGAREIPTATAFAEHHLRGYTDAKGMYDGTARHGMSPTDTDVIYLNLGRPVAVHQVTTGLARGGVYPSTYDDVPEPYRDAIRESDVKEPWASIAYYNRFSFSVPFWWRSLATANAFGTLDPYEVLLWLGNSPEFARIITDHFVGTGATPTDKDVTGAQTRLKTAAHKAFLDSEISATDATNALETAGVNPSSVPAILSIWDTERQLVRKGITAAQYKKAFEKQDVNDSTGQPWTRDETIAELVRLGYSHAEANQYLDIG